MESRGAAKARVAASGGIFQRSSPDPGVRGWRISALFANIAELPPMTEGGVSSRIPPAIEIVQARCQSGPSELRSGVLDIIMRPEKGWLSSKIRKMAHDADSANRDRKSESCHVQLSEQAETCEYDNQPENQDRQERGRNQIAGFHEQQETSLGQIGADLCGASLQRSLKIVQRRQVLNVQISFLASRAKFKFPCRIRFFYPPKAIRKLAEHASHLFANRTGFRSILRQQVVEQDYVGSKLLDLCALGVKRTLRRRNQQAKDKRSNGCNEPRAKPHDILRLFA
jgi:hypothetical protein